MSDKTICIGLDDRGYHDSKGWENNCPYCEIERLERSRHVLRGNAERWEKLAMTYKRELRQGGGE